MNIGVSQTGGWNIGVDQSDVTTTTTALDVYGYLSTNSKYWGVLVLLDLTSQVLTNKGYW